MRKKEKEIRLRLSERRGFLVGVHSHRVPDKRVIGRVEGQIEALSWVLGEEEKKD